MNAIILSQSKHHVGSIFTRCAVLLAVAAVLGSAGTAHAGLLYSNGQNINLAAGRATTYSATPGAVSVNNAELIEWPAYPGGDYRFGTSVAGPGQFTMDFGRVYNVSEYYFNLHSVFSGGSANYNLQTSTDGITYTTQQTYSGATLGSGVDTQVRGTLSTAVDARYVRLDLQNWVGYPQFIITKAQVYGNNTDQVTTRGNFSIAQSASNNGVATLRDRIFSPSSEAPRPALNDDGESPTTDFYGKVLTSMRPLPTDPSQVTVALNDLYRIDRVAFTTIDGARSWKDVNVWTSPDASGTNWFQQLTLAGLPSNDIYQEFSFSSVEGGVRFDVLNDNQNNTDTYGAEVYVYAAPDSPAVLNSDPADGSTLLIPYEPGQLGVLTSAVTLSNIGGSGSIVDVEDYTITPGFALLNFDLAQLVVGLGDSIAFDISFDPMVAPSGLGVLTLFTSEGELTFQLQAAVVPEPTTLALFGLGVFGLAVRARRRRTVA